MSFARRKPWTRPDNLVPKALGLSAVDKGPTRSTDWLTRVRGLPCLICAHGKQTSPTEAHHPKGLFERSTGRKISDLLVLPVCCWHHTYGPDALHRTGDEAGWWKRNGIEPYGVIISMLAQCRDPNRDEAIAMAKLQRERMNDG